MMKRLLLALAFIAGLASPVLASQGTGCIPTTGTMSGLQLVTRINAAIDALISTNSGSTAPVTACAGASLTGQLWIDTSTTPNVLKIYDGTSTNWLAIGTIDATSHIWTPPVGGGTNSLVAAATTDLGSVPQAYVAITGSTGITSFGSSAKTGTIKFVSFTGTPAVSYNATSLILPTAATITAQAGDKALFVYLGGGNWAAMSWIRADGTALATTAVLGGQISFTGIITPSALTVSTNDWAPSGLATASTIRASGTIDLNITGLTAQPSGTIIILNNVGSTILTLVDASASSSAANRFAFGADVLLGPSQSIILRYDGTLTNWTAAAAYKRPATQSQATAGTDNSTYMTPLRTAQAIAALATSAGTDYQPFTTSGTWAKPSGTTSSSVTCVEAWGAGGGGGSGGGGGAGYKYKCVLTSTLGSTETVTVATGGAVNTAGGNTTFGSLVTAYGGGASISGGAGGGGGGGLTSQGANSGVGGPGGQGGSPSLGASGGGAGSSSGGAGAAGGGGGGQSGGTGGYGSAWGGGGGGGNGGGGGSGGAALYGGAGGGSTATAAQSIYGGGNGGTSGVAGTAPGGGGGSSAAGARGEVRVTTFK